MRLLLGILALASACSADAAPEPELDPRVPGTFTAFQREEGGFDLLRTVGGAALDDGDRVMTFIFYDVLPGTIDEARTLARRPSLPERVHQYFDWQSQILARPHQAVWFRTLTNEEIRTR